MTLNNNIWIIVVDSNQALFYLKNKHGKLVKIFSLNSIKPDQEGTNTKNLLGRSFESTGNTRHIIEPHMDKHTHFQMQFITEVKKQLEDSLTNHSYHQLIIIAPPKIMGLLDKMLNKQVKGVIVQKLNKELAHLNDNQIEQALKKEGVID